MKTFIACFLLATVSLAQTLDSAISSLTEKANSGDAYAQAVLGTHYRKGFKVDLDAKKALDLMRKSADQKNPIGLFGLALMIEGGEGGIGKDADEALKLYKASLDAGLADLARSGDAFAQTFYGYLLMEGKAGNPKDERAGLEWRTKAADAGNPFAQAFLAFTIEKTNPTAALKYARLAATQGFPGAKELADTLGFDPSVTKSKAEAFKGRTLVFKGFYLGMPVEDAQALVNHYMGLKQTSATAKEDNSEMSQAKDSSNPEAAFAAAMLQALGEQVKGMSPSQLKAQGLDDKTIAALGISGGSDSYQVFLKKGNKVVARNAQERPFAVADASGKVVALELNRTIISKMFDAGDMPTKEFLQTFINSYKIPKLEAEQSKVSATIMGTTKEIGFQNVLRHRSPQGYEVVYYDDTVILEDGMETFANTPPEGTLAIKKIETAKARESKFD